MTLTIIYSILHGTYGSSRVSTILQNTMSLENVKASCTWGFACDHHDGDVNSIQVATTSHLSAEAMSTSEAKYLKL